MVGGNSMEMDSKFHPTHWTLVVSASGKGAEAKGALSDLCEVYYRPVVGFLRREGRDEDEAREVAHAFFESVLQGGVGSPDPERGRFRNYLLGALKNFLSKRRDASLALKRGGEIEHVSLAADGDFSSVPGVHDDTLAFDREWAMTLIGRALSILELEHEGKEHQFAILKPWLDTAGSHSQADAARELGMSESAVKVAIHRLRARFRLFLRAEVAATVADPADVADELRHLVEITSKG